MVALSLNLPYTNLPSLPTEITLRRNMPSSFYQNSPLTSQPGPPCTQLHNETSWKVQKRTCRIDFVPSDIIYQEAHITLNLSTLYNQHQYLTQQFSSILVSHPITGTSYFLELPSITKLTFINQNSYRRIEE